VSLGEPDSQDDPLGIKSKYDRYQLRDNTKGNPYEDKHLRLKLVFPESYPKHPPRAYFIHEVFHPSVGPDGLIGLTLLDGPRGEVEPGDQKTVAGRYIGTWGMGVDWTEKCSIAKILVSIRNMTEDPTDKDRDCVVLNEEAMQLASFDRDTFDARVLACFNGQYAHCRENKTAPLTPAAQAAKTAAVGKNTTTAQIEALKKKFGVSR